MVFEIIKRVIENLRAYGKRSVMTIIGITWGIASFILLMAYGDDFHRALLLGIRYFGDNVVIVWNGQAAGERAASCARNRKMPKQSGNAAHL
jgi:hypothetical protein